MAKLCERAEEAVSKYSQTLDAKERNMLSSMDEDRQVGYVTNPLVQYIIDWQLGRHGMPQSQQNVSVVNTTTTATNTNKDKPAPKPASKPAPVPEPENDDDDGGMGNLFS